MIDNKQHRIILSGGGTGGHIYPAIAIADELKSRFPDAEFLFVGASDYSDAVFVTKGGRVGVRTLDPQRQLHINDVMRLEPRATAPSSPAKGDIYMDDITNKLRVYDGTQWQDCW